MIELVDLETFLSDRKSAAQSGLTRERHQAAT